MRGSGACCAHTTLQRMQMRTIHDGFISGVIRDIHRQTHRLRTSAATPCSPYNAAACGVTEGQVIRAHLAAFDVPVLRDLVPR